MVVCLCCAFTATAQTYWNGTADKNLRGVSSHDAAGSVVWYDLSGRKLQSKPTQKGVYFKNGKKMFVKKN